MTVFGTEQERKDYFSKCEKIGETEIRIQINMGIWQERNRMMFAYAQEWLRLIDEGRALEASSKRDEREERTLKLAEEANSIALQARSDARAANKIAITAAIFAAIATICAAIITVIGSPNS